MTCCDLDEDPPLIFSIRRIAQEPTGAGRRLVSGDCEVRREKARECFRPTSYKTIKTTAFAFEQMAYSVVPA